MKNEPKKQNTATKTTYAQNHESASLSFPFAKQILMSFYSNDCLNEKELILFHSNLSFSCY